MAHKPNFIHPSTLEIGKIYLRKNGSQAHQNLIPIQFIEYSTCPAIVIISDGGKRERCPRADLFLPEDV